MINKAILVGRITTDIDVRTSAGGSSYTKFSIALDRMGSEQTDFINCCAFGKVAENMGRFLKKGSLVAIDGRIQSSSYKRNDGSTTTNIEVVASNVQFLEPRGSKSVYSAPAPKTSIADVNKGLEAFADNPKPKPAPKQTGISNDLDDIPWNI